MPAIVTTPVTLPLVSTQSTETAGITTSNRKASVINKVNPHGVKGHDELRFPEFRL